MTLSVNLHPAEELPQRPVPAAQVGGDSLPVHGPLLPGGDADAEYDGSTILRGDRFSGRFRGLVLFGLPCGHGGIVLASFSNTRGIRGVSTRIHSATRPTQGIDT